MANSYSALNPTEMVDQVQDFQRLSFVSGKIANLKFKDKLKKGSVVDFPYTSDPSVQTYTPGTDLTADADTGVANQVNIDETPAVMITDDPNSLSQRADKQLQMKRRRRCGIMLGNRVDQKVINEIVTNAYSGNTVAGGTLSSTTIFGKLTDAVANIQDYEIDGPPMFCVVDPARRALLTQYFVGNGFNEGDVALRNGFFGRAAGMEFYVSNNLKFSQTLQMATKPTATDTVVIKGVTFTFVSTIGTTAGNVLIGADVAASQTNIRTLVNAPGTTTATGVALSLENQRKFTNQQVSMAAWSANTAVVTAYGKIAGTETFTDATDTWGTETGNLIAGRKGAPSLLMQRDITYYEGREARRPEINDIFHQLYGQKLFYRDTFRVAKISYNA